MNICYSADFTPALGQYHDLSPFRMWCQKVIPLVYDDSLSYYEVLCKLVNHLNVMLQNVETLAGDVNALHVAYIQLQDYVNHYFDNLDVQEEINNKLDEMVEDGTLENILRKINTNLLYIPGISLRGEIFALPYIDRVASSQGVVVKGSTYYVAFDSDGVTYIQKYTNEILQNTITGNYGHANSIDASDTELYVVDTDSASSKIHIFSLDNFSFKETITTNIPFLSGITWDGNRLLGISNTGGVYDITNNKKITQLEQMTVGQWQGSTITNNTIIVCRSNPNTLYIFDMSGTIINTINVGAFIQNTFALDELEDISIYNDKMYLSGNNSQNPNIQADTTSCILEIGLNRNTECYSGYRSGFATTTLTADGKETNKTKRKGGIFKTPQDCINKIKSLPPAKYEISITYDCYDPITLEALNAFMLRLSIAQSVKLYSDIYAYDCNISIIGNYSLTKLKQDYKITISNYGVGFINLSYSGTITNDNETDFISALGNGNIFLNATGLNQSEISVSSGITVYGITGNTKVNRGAQYISRNYITNYSGYATPYAKILKGNVGINLSQETIITYAQLGLTGIDYGTTVTMICNNNLKLTFKNCYDFYTPCTTICNVNGIMHLVHAYIDPVQGGIRLTTSYLNISSGNVVTLSSIGSGFKIQHIMFN